MATVIESLLMEVGVDVDEKSLKKFNEVTDKTVKTLKQVAIVAAATGAAVVAYTVALASATDENAKFSDQIGVSFDTLQELGFAAEREGANLESLKGSLAALTRVAGQASMGMGPGIEAFARLGMNIFDANGQLKSADTLFNEVSDSIQGLTKAEQADLISKLGISNDLILLLQKGTTNLEMLRKEARSYGLESDRMAKSSQQFQDNMTNLKAAITGVLLPLRQLTLDVINDLLPGISDWIRANRSLIKTKFLDFIKDVADNSEILIESVKRLWPAVKRLGESIINLFGDDGGDALLNITAAITTAVDLIAMSFEGWSLIIDGLSEGIEFLIEQLDKLANSKAGKAFSKLAEGVSVRTEDKGFLGNIRDFYGGILQDISSPETPSLLQDIAPPVATPLPQGNNQSSIINNQAINANIEISSTTGDPLSIGNAVRSAIENIARNGIENQNVSVLV